MDFYNHIWSPSLFPRGIIIFQGVLTKFNFLMKFQHLEKFVDLTLWLLVALDRGHRN